MVLKEEENQKQRGHQLSFQILENMLQVMILEELIGMLMEDLISYLLKYLWKKEKVFLTFLWIKVNLWIMEKITKRRQL